MDSRQQVTRRRGATVADRDVSLRRSLEQAAHCVQEALSVVERREDPRCAMDDVIQAAQLLRGKVSDELVQLIEEAKLKY
jgi:hypothetical protein